MRKHKFLALFCCMILFLSLTACNGANSNSASAVDNGKPAAPTVVETESNAESTAPSSNVEEPLPPLGEEDVTPAEFDEVTLQWRNGDGYLLEGTFAISDWIKYDNSDLLNATWKSISGGLNFPNISKTMPMGEEMSVNYLKRVGHKTGDIVYAVGYFKIVNVTEGFDITADNYTNTSAMFYINTLFSALVTTKTNVTSVQTYLPNPNGVCEAKDEILTNPGTTGGAFGGIFGIPITLSSNETDAVPFVIAVSISTTTPNRPDPLPDISQVMMEVRYYNHDNSINNGETIDYFFTQEITW